MKKQVFKSLAIFAKILIGGLFIIFPGQKTNAQIISNLAGADFLADGKQATLSMIKQPIGIATDKQGNVYFADAGNNVIRKIDIKTGIITNYAGNGKIGANGVGSLAVNASLNYPRAIRFDTAGNGYLLDSNSIIKKVTKATGNISKIIGSGQFDSLIKEVPALEASFAFAINFTIDNQGNIFVVDRNTHTVRKMSATTGIVSVIAGNGTAGTTGDGGLATSALLTRPNWIEVDDSSNLYISDLYRIRKINAITGIITTIAGDGTAGTSNDSLLAINSKIPNVNTLHVDKLGNIYFDMNGGLIKKIEKSTGLMFTIIGGGGTSFSGDGGLAINATINNPRGIVTDFAGNIFISDLVNNRIRKIEASTTKISTIAGIGNFYGDNGSATAATLNYPQGVAVDKEGNVYIADRSNNRIRKINALDGIITSFIGSGGTSSLLINTTNSVAKNEVDIPYVTNVVADTLTGNLFINTRPVILKYTKSTGMVSWYAGMLGSTNFTENVAATTAVFNAAIDIAIDKSGNVYTIETSSNTIRKITASTGKINTVVNSSRTAGFSGDGGNALAAKIASPYCLAFDNVNNMYIGDLGNNRIRKVTPAGVITTIAGTGVAGFSGDNGLATQAKIGYPVGIAVDNFSNVIFIDGTRIRKINTTTGIITTIAGTELSGPFVNNVQALNSNISPRNLTVDKYGNIYLTEPNSNAVREIYYTPNVEAYFENVGNFDQFSGCVGSASSTQEFFVDGNTLIDSVRVSASADFEISLNGTSNFGNSIVIPPVLNKVTPTKIYARLIAKTTIGNFSGVISISSKNANTKSLILNGSTATMPVSPSITANGNKRICSGQSLLLSSNALEGNQWYFNGQPIVSSTDTVYSAKSTGDYTVAKIVNGCASAQSTKVNLIVDDYPPTPIARDTTYCLGDIADTLKATALINNSLQWYGTSQTGGIASAISIKPSTTTVGLFNYYVSQKTNISGCESLRTKLVVKINQTPTAPILVRDSANNLVANTNSLSWFKNGILLSDTTKIYKPTTAGLYTVKTFQNGCFSIASNAYYYILTDIININTDEFIKVYPNPYSNKVNLEYNLKAYKTLNIDIIDLTTGIKILTKQSVSTGTPLFLGQLSGGVYLLKVYTNDNKINYQFKMIKI